jgi:Rad3-related DNA helicase
MTSNDYRELVDFLGRRLDKSDRRTDARFASLENRLARVEVGNEENAHKIQVLAEGISGVGQSVERFRKEVAEEFRAVRGEMAEGFRVQGDRIDGLGARMDRWVARSL